MSNEIGSRIKETRLKLGLKQKELAEKIGVSESRISQYENGSQNPRINTLIKLSEALGVSLKSLCGDEWEKVDYEARTEYSSPFIKYLWSIGYRVDTAFKPEPFGKSEINIPQGYAVTDSNGEKTLFTKEQFEIFEKSISDSVSYHIWQQQHKK